MVFDKWYRSPLPAEEVKQLCRRSDGKGLLQTGGMAALLAGLAALTVWSWPSWWFLLPLFLYGTAFSFLTAASHELCHGSPFKSKGLNEVVYFLVSFLILKEPVHHRAWHFTHHRQTMQTAIDGDPELQMQRPAHWWRLIFFFVLGNYDLSSFVRHSVGRVSQQEARFINRKKWPTMFRNARVILAGHLLVMVVSAWLRNPLPLLLISLPTVYGGWLHRACSLTQHPGLPENTPDFRLCCRSIRLSPLLSFLYWNMHYHIEHHMYPGVPFHALPALNNRIKADLPVRKSLLGAWREMVHTFARQQHDRDYVCVPTLPQTAHPVKAP